MHRPSRILLAVLLAALAAPAPARAGVSADAARVVRRYRDAVGGTADSVRTLYTRARVSGFGFTGSLETWAVRADRQFSRTELGPFRLSEGFDRDVSWRTDPTTSNVVRESGSEVDDARSDAWFAWERWAEPGGGGGDVRALESVQDSSGSFAVLLARPPAGRERRLWFDQATGLLARSEARNDQQTFVTETSDWRVAAGRRRPFRTVTSVVGMPLNRLTADVDSMVANVSVVGVTFAPPDSTPEPPVTWNRTPGVARLPFEYRARHLWVRASLDGGPLQDFILDTGASVTVLDSTWAASQGIRGEGRMQASGAGASGGASFAHVKHLSIRGAPDDAPGAADGIAVDDLRVAVMSVNPVFEPYFWRPLAGVIGYDVLSRFVVTIDYDRHVVELHDPATFRADGLGESLPLVLQGPIPAVMATLDGKHRGLFRLDIGSSSTVDLHGPFVERNGLAKRLRHGVAVAGAGFGGTFESRLGRLRRMSIGPHAWRDPMVQLSFAREGAFASEDFAGNIGNRVLERFRVTFDYDGHRLWLTPGARAHVRDSLSRAGVMIGRVGETFEVMSVLPGSPADRAGLGPEDEILSVDGRAMSEWRHEDLEALLDRGMPGREVPVVVRRDGGPQTLVIVLREVLP